MADKKPWIQFNSPWAKKPLSDDMSKTVMMDGVEMSVEEAAEAEEMSLYDNAQFFSTLGVRAERDRTVLTLMNRLRERQDKRAKRFEEYRLVGRDSIVGQAIELMSDDATRFDVERDRTIWIESDNKKFADHFNGLLQLYVEPFIDSIATSILSLGEFAFKVIPNKKGESQKDKEQLYKFVLLPFRKIERLHHLILQDYSRYFVVIDDITKVSKEIEILDYDKYIHFINASLEKSMEVEIALNKGDSLSGSKKPTKEPVFVLNGESIITEKVLEDFRILKTLEDAIIVSRLDKSKMIRFINVEVSKMDNVKAANLVNYIDGLINKNENISKASDVYHASRIQAQPVTVVMPMKQEKGRVTIEETGGSVDIKDIVDIEYFINRLFSGLRTPKEYLGFGTEGGFPGIQSSASLMRTHIRYSRVVQKCQRVLIQGIETLVELFKKEHGYKEDQSYKVRVIQSTTAEDEERYLELDNRIAMSNTFIDSIMNQETGELDIPKIDMMIQFFIEVVPTNSVVQYLNKIKKKIKIVSKPEGLETQ